jgi:glycosyltransferase involved in cell wall biosynthesis
MIASNAPMDAKRTDATLVICAHNPRPAYLERVLASVREQSLGKDCWELIVVDNLSAVPLASNWDLSWHPRGRHVMEGELGLSAARRRAIKEASSDLLIFVDDDNVLDPAYIARAVEIKHAWPRLGVWGAGVIIPEFEVQPTEYVKPLLHYLALREIGAPRWTNVFPCFEATPWGAGLCVRASVAAAYRQDCEQSSIQITGRRGQAVLSGEDLEINYLACQSGYGMGIFPELKLTHLIPKQRITENYLLKIVEAAALANLLLDYKLEGRIPRSPFSARGSMSLLKNLLVHRGIGRRRSLANARAEIKARKIIADSM